MPEWPMKDIKKNTPPVAFAKAIADSTRQKIMSFCCCDWRSVTDIVDHMGVTQPTVSHPLAILRDAGLVDVRHEGKLTYYRLDQKRIANCCGVISQTFAPEEEELTAPAKHPR
jgi:ArsR family transcriptional regulator